ncbi:MAG: hypothetical protein ACE5HX_17065, partial [bacterium]
SRTSPSTTLDGNLSPPVQPTKKSPSDLIQTLADLVRQRNSFCSNRNGNHTKATEILSLGRIGLLIQIERKEG